MNPERLLNVLSEMRSLREDFVAALKRELSFISLPKAHFLVDGAAISQSAFFLEKGFVVGYTFYGNKRSVTAFWKEGEIIFSPPSFYAQVPSTEFIQLAEDSELLCIGREGVRRLWSEFAEADDLCRRIAAQYVERYRLQVLRLQNDSTRARYAQLTEAYPGIELRVSQELIASYLGISAPALSRLKSKMRRV